MKCLLHSMLPVAVLLALAAVPAEDANAYWGWGPGYGAWRHAYFYDPAYRFASPAMRAYIRDLYLRGPEYAAWRQQIRYGWW